MPDNATTSSKSELVADATAVDPESSQLVEPSCTTSLDEVTKTALAVHKASSILKGMARKEQNEQQQENKQEQQ